MAFLLVRVPLSARVGRQYRTGPDQGSTGPYVVNEDTSWRWMQASLVMCEIVGMRDENKPQQGKKGAITPKINSLEESHRAICNTIFVSFKSYN